MGESEAANSSQPAAKSSSCSGKKKKRKNQEETGDAEAGEEEAKEDAEAAAEAKAAGKDSNLTPLQREEMKWAKKLREIEAIEKKLEAEGRKVDPMQKEKLDRKPDLQKAL